MQCFQILPIKISPGIIVYMKMPYPFFIPEPSIFLRLHFRHLSMKCGHFGVQNK